jgi:hypothetical protein
MTSRSIPALGIDFGGVIVPSLDRNRASDTQFSDRFLTTPPQPGVFDAVRLLTGKFQGQVWIVSKAGERTETLTRNWLEANDFFRRTGMSPQAVRFCRERQQKQVICDSLKITHFIDDRVHVMQILRDKVPHLYLFGAGLRGRNSCRWAVPVPNWSEAQEAIVRSLSH